MPANCYPQALWVSELEPAGQRAWANALRLALDINLPSNSVVSVTVNAPHNAPEVALPDWDGSPEPNIRNNVPCEGDQLDLGLA